MDEFMKNLSSPTPIKPSAICKISSSNDWQERTTSSKEAREINENEQDLYHQMSSKLQNPKKSAPKHFMSPTVSAASKAAGPRKKILVERNEDSGSIISDTHVHKTPKIGARVAPADSSFDNLSGYSSQITPISSKISEPDDDVPNSLPYDPLTNYLSPRPKFLRYNPNRRSEILLRRESEQRKGGDGLAVNQYASLEPQKPVEEEAPSDAYASSSSSSQEGSIKHEDGSSLGVDESGATKPSENEKTTESEDEEEDELEVEEVEEKRGPCNEVFNIMMLLAAVILSTLYISSMNSPTAPPSLQALWDLKEGYQKFEDGLLRATVENFVVGNTSFDQKEENIQHLLNSNGRIYDEGNEELVEQKMEKTGEISDQKDGIEVHERETAEISEFLEVSQLQLVPDWMDHTSMVYEEPSFSESEINSDKEEHVELMQAESNSKDEQSKDEAIIKATERITGIGEEMVENEVEKAGNFTDGMGEMIELQGRGTAEISESFEVHKTQFMIDRIGDQNIKSDFPSLSETELNLDKEHIDPMKGEPISKAAMGISVLSLIAGSMILGFLHLKHRRTPAKDSSPAVQPSFESTVIENSTSALPNIEERIEERIEQANSYVNASSSVKPVGKGPKELYQSRAPTVELLGEFVVGELSSSLKSCSMMKSKPTESEESSFSESQEQMSRRKGIPPANHEYASLSEFSATKSPSYGSFTAQGKIAKKEESEDREVLMQAVTTPVRRSSRIRNRAVMSP